MNQLFYWVGSFAKTVSLLSLIILVPDNPYLKQLLSKGFLLLYVNEILLFLIETMVNMFSQPQFGQYFPLSQLIMNIYYLVIIGVVVVWLLKYQSQFLSQEMASMSVVVSIFVWMAVVTVGLVAVATKTMDNVRALGELSYALGWMMSLLKFIIQYRLNSQSHTFGLGFIYLFTNIAWTACQLLSMTIQQQQRQKQVAFNISTIFLTLLLGIASIVTNIIMVNQRKQSLHELKEIERENKKLQKDMGLNVTESLVVDERLMPKNQPQISTKLYRQGKYDEEQFPTATSTLNETLLNKDKPHHVSTATTKQSTSYPSFAQSIEHY